MTVQDYNHTNMMEGLNKTTKNAMKTKGNLLPMSQPPHQ